MVDLLRSMLTECVAVAERLGVELPVSLERRLQAGIDVGDHKTSMLQDLEAGKPIELDCMTGAVLELARKLDLPAPHTSTVYACTKLLDELRRAAVTDVAV
jgi:2-dehydropantoate 2-reductase